MKLEAMIKIQRIRLNDVNMTLTDRKSLNRLREILTNNFETKNILFEYEESEEIK
jgi:hypothetical protein